MVSSIRRLSVIFIFLLALPACIFARKSNSARQSVAAEDKNTSMDNENGESSEETLEFEEIGDEESEIAIEESWQVLEWEAGDSEFALHYNIIIEKYNEKKQAFEPCLELRAENTDTSVEIRPRQSPGKYRYKIVTYNLVGAPSTESEWLEFSIFPALLPRITSISSAVTGSATILKGFNDGIFIVEGRNLFAPNGNDASEVSSDSDDSRASADSDDSTEKPSVTSKTSYTLINRQTGAQLIPEILESQKSGRRIKMRLDISEMEVGEYMLTATDASGLKSENEKNLIIVKSSEGSSFDFSFGYSLPFALYGGTYPEYIDSKLYLYNAYAKMDLMFFKRKYGHFGIGLNAHANHIKFKNDAYTIKGNTIDAYLNAVYQFPINFSAKNEKKHGKRIATLEIHSGVGVLLFNDFQFTFANNAQSSAFNSFGISVQIGADIQLFLGRKFFFELGVDYINAFMPDSAFGEVIPLAGIGWHL